MLLDTQSTPSDYSAAGLEMVCTVPVHELPDRISYGTPRILAANYLLLNTNSHRFNPDGCIMNTAVSVQQIDDSSRTF